MISTASDDLERKLRLAGTMSYVFGNIIAPCRDDFSARRMSRHLVGGSGWDNLDGGDGRDVLLGEGSDFDRLGGAVATMTCPATITTII
jgi:hypothetical protein